jgi:hypothetical protein
MPNFDKLIDDALEDLTPDSYFVDEDTEEYIDYKFWDESYEQYDYDHGINPDDLEDAEDCSDIETDDDSSDSDFDEDSDRFDENGDWLDEKETAITRNKLKRRKTLEALWRVRLKMGTFAAGNTIYRNRLTDEETLEDGFVGLESLVPPDVQAVTATTFISPRPNWFWEWIPDVRKLVVIRHNHTQSKRRTLGDANVTTFQQQKQWLFVTANPRSTGYMHAKLLLFRSPEGLRVVIPGNDLCEKQWQTKRDFIWIQDFNVKSNSLEPVEAAKKKQKSKRIKMRERKERRLRATFDDLLWFFLSDLTNCRRQKYKAYLESHKRVMLNNIDFSAAVAKLVLSYPRVYTSKKEKGGFKMLAKAVNQLLRDGKTETEENYPLDDSSDDAANSVSKLLLIPNSSMPKVVKPTVDDEGTSTQEPGAPYTMLSPADRSRPSSQEYSDKVSLTRVTAMVRGVRDKMEDGEQIFVLPGSLTADIRPDFLVNMCRSMLGETKELHIPKEVPWDLIEGLGLRVLWPSRRTLLSLKWEDIMSWERAMSMEHWKSIPCQIKRKLFVDTKEKQCSNHHPYPIPFRSRLILRHGGSTSFLYFGSHNFTDVSWGIRNKPPHNVEIGILIATNSESLQKEWISRINLCMPDPDSVLSDDYIPATAHQGIRYKFLSKRFVGARYMLEDWLNKTDQDDPPEEITKPKYKPIGPPVNNPLDMDIDHLWYTR